MYNGNPFRKRTLRINEGFPSKRWSFRRPRAIEIEPDKKRYDAAAKLKAINSILERVKHKDRIRLFGIHYSSNLRRLPDINLFPELSYAHIAGRRIKTYEKLYELKNVQRLFLCSYTQRDMSSFSHLKLRKFRAIRGGIELFDISADKVLLQDCRHLRRFGRVTIRDLCIENSQNTDLDTLGHVQGLARLQLLSRKSIPSFDFLRDIPTLQDLVITANALNRTDISYLLEAPIPKMFLGVRNALIRKIGTANPRTIVTNSAILMHKGVCTHDTSLYYDE